MDKTGSYRNRPHSHQHQSNSQVELVTETDIIAGLHRWNWKKADRSKFQEDTIKSIEEARATSTDKEQSIKQAYKVMVDTILRAADKPFCNDKCEAAVQERNSARQEAENDKVKIEDNKAKDKEAKNIIDNEKLEFWKERVQHFDILT